MSRYRHPSPWTYQELMDYAPVQAAIMEIITDFKRDPENDGNSPALADIAQALGKSRRRTGNIEKHISSLIRKGLVRINDKSKIVLIGGRYIPPPLDYVYLAQTGIVHRAKYASTEIHQAVRKEFDLMRHTEREIFERMYEQQRGHCWWCDEPIGGIFHVDHRIPISKGGTNRLENLVIACPDCNLRKSDKMPWEFNGRLV